MFIDERMARFYSTITMVANRCLLVGSLLFFIAFLFLSPPLAFLVLVAGIGYYAYTEWLEEQRREMYAFYDRMRYVANTKRMV